MRRVGGVVVVASALLVVTAPGARAEEPGPSSAASGAPATACTVSDERASHLVGIAATDTGYVVVNRTGEDVPGGTQVLLLSKACKVVSSTGYASRPSSPQDVAVAKDGSVWVADIGDPGTSANRRKTIAMWKFTPSGGRLSGSTIYRMQYPDGAHDAAAVLIGGDGLPVVITKESRDPAGIYKPAAALQAGSATGVALQRVGEFRPGQQGTRNKFGAVGWNVVTGGAVSADGTRAVLRTYSDAYEFDVAGGDVVAAIKTAKPRVTQLPNEPLGEGITYSRDGATFVTVSDVTGANPLLTYRPAAATVQAATTPTRTTTKAASGGLWRPTSVQEILYLVAGAGVLGIVLVVVGIVGIMRSRSRRRSTVSSSTLGRSVDLGGDDDGQHTGVYTTAGSRGDSTSAQRGVSSPRMRSAGSAQAAVAKVAGTGGDPGEARYGRSAGATYGGGVYGRPTDADRTGGPI